MCEEAAFCFLTHSGWNPPLTRYASAHATGRATSSVINQRQYALLAAPPVFVDRGGPRPETALGKLIMAVGPAF